MLMSIWYVCFHLEDLIDGTFLIGRCADVFTTSMIKFHMFYSAQVALFI